MRLTYLIWSLFLIMIAIGLSCLEEPTSINKNMIKDTDMIQTNPIDSIKNAYSYTLSPVNQDIQNIAKNEGQDKNLSINERNNYDMNLTARMKNEASKLNYKKIKSDSISGKKNNNNYNIEKRAGLLTKYSFIRVNTISNNERKPEIKNLIITSYIYVFGRFKIFWQSHPFGKQFFF